MQRRSAWLEPNATPPIVKEVLGSRVRPLEPETREFFEARFGYDFSEVRIHSDALAADSARAVNALAYTVGNEIVFSQGRFAPNRTTSRALLAHELTHVVQQSPAGPAKALRIGAVETPQEQEAERNARGVASSANAPISFASILSINAPILQRQEAASIPDLPDSTTSPFGGAPQRSASEIYQSAQYVSALYDSNFDTAIRQPGTVVVLDFWDESCRPCDRVAAHLVSLARDYQSGLSAGRVRFFHVEWDRRVNPSLYARFTPFIRGRGLPLVHFYFNAPDRPVLEDSLFGANSRSEYASRIERILRRHGAEMARPQGGHLEQSSSAAPRASAHRSGSLLIHDATVRREMKEAYVRSSMGGLTAQEWGGIIVQTPSGNLRCLLFTSGQRDRLPTCPSDDEFVNGSIGTSPRLGAFHTHPTRQRLKETIESPSPADKNAIAQHPECLGSESYVIGLEQIYVIFPDGAWQALGSTNDWLGLP